MDPYAGSGDAQLAPMELAGVAQVLSPSWLYPYVEDVLLGWPDGFSHDGADDKRSPLVKDKSYRSERCRTNWRISMGLSVVYL